LEAPFAALRNERNQALPAPGLIDLKTDPLLDPLRKEPRYQTIEREIEVSRLRCAANGR
jgi:hypothetical protein